MKRAAAYVFILIMLAVLVTKIAVTQVATGAPPYSTINGNPDQVNLANLNVHLTIPVLHKNGRGLPFDFDLAYDSSFWYPVLYNGTTYWDPVPTAGWGGSVIDIGYLWFIAGTDGVEYDYMCDFVYYDGLGTPHWFGPGNGVFPYCAVYDFYYGIDYPYAAMTTDNSGYTLTADAYTGIMTLTSADGDHIIPMGTLPLNPQVQPGSVFDRNGNEITENTSGQFTDTLGTIALTQSGGTQNPKNPQPSYFKYTGPNSTPEQVVATPIAYTVMTNFQCTNPKVVDYPAQVGSLVDTITLQDHSTYHFTYEQTPGTCTPIAGTYSGYCTTARIASVTLPTGGTISYKYTGGNNGIECSDGSASGLQRTTPDSTTPWNYSRTLGSGAAMTTTMTDPLGNETITSFQGIYETQRQVYTGSSTLLETVNTCYNGSASPCTGIAITLPIAQRTATTELGIVGKGVESQTVTFYNSNGLASEEDDYDFGTTGGSPGGLLRKVLFNYATLGNGILDKISSVTVEDGGSHVVSQVNLGYDETAPTPTQGTPQHISGFSGGNLTSLSAYVNSSTNLYQTFTYYDTGNILTSTDASTSKTVKGAPTTYSYGSGSCGNSFVTSIAEPLNLSKSMTWDCTGGVVTSTTDENSQQTTLTYVDSGGNADPFWRALQVTTPYQGATLTDLDAYTPNLETNEVAISSSGAYSSRFAGLDSLGRDDLIATDMGPRSTCKIVCTVLGCTIQCVGSKDKYDVTGTLFDAAGHGYLQQLPYNSATVAVDSSNTTGTETTYDGLSRPLQVTDSGGGYTSSNYAPDGTYNHNDVLETLGPLPGNGFENLKQKQLEYDGLGRTTSVCELTSGTGSGSCKQNYAQTGYWTKYTYNAVGKIASVAQNAQGTAQNRTFIYDGLGRLSSENNPETGGTTYYTYDSDSTCGSLSTYPAGNLLKTVDPAGNVTCYGWDALHRNIVKTYTTVASTATTPTKCFVYDGATVNGSTMPYAKTHLAEAYTTSSTSCPSQAKIVDLGFGYSQRGELTDVYESSPNSGGYYHTTAAYWGHGAIQSLTGVPGESSFAFNLSSMFTGLLGSITQGSGAAPVLSDVSYNASNQVTNTRLGSDDKDNYTYDASTDRVTQYSFNVGSQSVVGNLTWNANGTLSTLQITDPFNSANQQTCNFFHDDLARLGGQNAALNTVDCGAAWAQAFTFDPFGNISKSGSSSFGATYYANNRIKTVGSCAATYDSDGNLTNDCSYGYGYKWDADGNLATVTNGSTTLNLTYDALDRMVERQNGSTYTQVLYSPLGKQAIMNGQNRLTDYLRLPGGGAAVFDSTLGNYYRHSDHLGSARFASTSSQTMLYDRAFAPYGEFYANAGSTSDLNFTSQDQNTISGLYDFLYRRYHPVEGRWISPDRAGMAAVNPTNPQSWNRYAYVTNNPLAFVDPLGLDDEGCSPDDPSCGGGGDPCFDWGDCGDPGSGGGPSGPPVVVQGAPIYGCESLGIPCGGSLSDPLANQVAAARQAIAAAITGNWKQMLGALANGASQELWSMVPNPVVMDSGTGDWTDAEKLGIFQKVGNTAGQLNNPCSIGGFYAGSTLVGGLEVVGSAATGSEAFPAISDAFWDNSYWLSKANSWFQNIGGKFRNKIMAAEEAAGTYVLGNAKKACDYLSTINW